MQRLTADQFVQLMAWLEQTQNVARHTSLMAAALQLAAEACKVCLQVFCHTASSMQPQQIFITLMTSLL